MLEIGTQSVYRNVLPDFMVWNQVTELPLFWKPFYSAPFTLLAVVVVPGARRAASSASSPSGAASAASTSRSSPRRWRSRAWLMFNRNAMNLGGTNGLSGFKTHLRLPAQRARPPSAGSTSSPRSASAGAYLLCRWITRSPAGKVLVAIRDSETRVLFSGYSPAAFKLFVFVGLGDAGRGGGRALRAAGRHHHAGQDRRAAVHRDDHLGGGGRARHAARAGGRRLRRELAAEPADDAAIPISGCSCWAGSSWRSCSSSPTAWWAPRRS